MKSKYTDAEKIRIVKEGTKLVPNVTIGSILLM